MIRMEEKRKKGRRKKTGGEGKDKNKKTMLEKDRRTKKEKQVEKAATLQGLGKTTDA